MGGRVRPYHFGSSFLRSLTPYETDADRKGLVQDSKKWAGMPVPSKRAAPGRWPLQRQLQEDDWTPKDRTRCRRAAPLQASTVLTVEVVIRRGCQFVPGELKRGTVRTARSCSQVNQSHGPLSVFHDDLLFFIHVKNGPAPPKIPPAKAACLLAAQPSHSLRRHETLEEDERIKCLAWPDDVIGNETGRQRMWLRGPAAYVGRA